MDAVMTLVSLVVPTQGASEEVERRFLAMIGEAAVESGEVEVVVVEDCGRGVAWARNQGLDRASGRWVLFADDDDNIDAKALDAIKPQSHIGQQTILPDIIEWGYRIIDESGVRQVVTLVRQPVVLRGEEIVEAMVGNRLFTSNVWNKLMRRSLIGDLRFREGLRYGEDWDFLWRLVAKAVDRKSPTLTMLVLPDARYDYIRHPGQVSAGFRSAKLDLPEAWSVMLADISCRYPHLLSEARATYASHLTVVLYDAYRASSPHSISQPLRKALRRHLARFWLSPHHSVKKKLAALCLSI